MAYGSTSQQFLTNSGNNNLNILDTDANIAYKTVGRHE